MRQEGEGLHPVGERVYDDVRDLITPQCFEGGVRISFG